jgi:hypothetical protein
MINSLNQGDRSIANKRRQQMSNDNRARGLPIVNDNPGVAPVRLITTSDLRQALKQNALADLTDIAPRLGDLNDPDIDQLLVAPLAALRAEIAKGGTAMPGAEPVAADL